MHAFAPGVRAAAPSRAAFLFTRPAGERGEERERTCKDAAGRGGYIRLRARAGWVPGASLPMEIAETTETPGGQRARCRLQPPAAPERQPRRGGADSGYRVSAPPCASPAPSLPPAPPQLLPSALSPPHPPGPRSDAVGSPGSGFTSPLRALCCPPRRSVGFWRPWVEDRGEKEEEAPHHAAEAVSEPRLPGALWIDQRRVRRAPGRHAPGLPLA